MKIALLVNADQMYEFASKYLNQPLSLNYQEMYKHFLKEDDTLSMYHVYCSDFDTMAESADPPPSEEEERHYRALISKFVNLGSDNQISEYATPVKYVELFIDVTYFRKKNEGTYTVSKLSDDILYVVTSSCCSKFNSPGEEDEEDKYDVDKLVVFFVGSPNVKHLEMCSRVMERKKLITTIVTVKDTPSNLIKGLIKQADEHIELDEGFFKKYWYKGEYESHIKKQNFIDIKNSKNMLTF